MAKIQYTNLKAHGGCNLASEITRCSTNATSDYTNLNGLLLGFAAEWLVGDDSPHATDIRKFMGKVTSEIYSLMLTNLSKFAYQDAAITAAWGHPR